MCRGLISGETYSKLLSLARSWSSACSSQTELVRRLNMCVLHLSSPRSPVGIPAGLAARGSFAPPRMVIWCLFWTGLSHISWRTGNANEPPLGMLRRKAKGWARLEPPGQRLSLGVEAGEGDESPGLGRRWQCCSKGTRGDHVGGRRAGCCFHIIWKLNLLSGQKEGLCIFCVTFLLLGQAADPIRYALWNPRRANRRVQLKADNRPWPPASAPLWAAGCTPCCLSPESTCTIKPCTPLAPRLRHGMWLAAWRRGQKMATSQGWGGGGGEGSWLLLMLFADV